MFTLFADFFRSSSVSIHFVLRALCAQRSRRLFHPHEIIGVILKSTGFINI